MDTSILLTQHLPADRNPALVYLVSLPSPKSQRSQAQALRRMAEWLGGDLDSVAWGALRYQHTAALRTLAIQRLAPATARKYVAALRGVLKHARRLGLISGEDYHNAIDLDSIEGEQLPAGRDLTQGEINALIYACIKDPTAAGVRDAAILSLMYLCAVRRSSVVALSWSDYDPNTGRLVWHGKRNKEYSAFVAGGAKDALDDWITLRGSEPGPMFYPVSQIGNIERHSEHLSDQTVYEVCKKRAAQAGVEHFTPHDIRRTTAGDMLDRGVDLVTVMKIMAHDDPKTTGHYDRRPERAKKDAAQKLHVPYTRRTSTQTESPVT